MFKMFGIKRTPNDDLWSLIIRVRAKWHCERCGLDCSSNKGYLDGAHIIRRGNWSMRHEVENGVALCKSCHLNFDDPRGEAEERLRKMKDNLRWIKKHLGHYRWKKLIIYKSRVTPNVKSKATQELIRVYLENELKKLTETMA